MPFQRFWHCVRAGPPRIGVATAISGAVLILACGAPKGTTQAAARDASTRAAPLTKAAPLRPQYTFTCSDGFVVRATFADDTVTVVFPDTTLIMQRLISADGGRYGAGNLVFWEKGLSAFLMRNDSIVHRDCARSDSAR